MDVLNSKSKSIDIQILNYKQCFDAMWLQETLNDMFEAGVTDNNLAVLYEANKKVKVAVKTPHGLTDREAINEIILQGDVFGPIECSVQVDTFGKECLTEDKFLYSYKGEVKVPALAMVDDLLIVSECGYKASMVNSFINTKTNLKKLQFGTNKCHKMHVGKQKIEEICPDLFVDGWKVKEVTEVETGKATLEDEHDGLVKMEEVKEDKYLGDVISQDGKNMKNILARKDKAVGVVTQIMSILEEICFGMYYFEVAVILRNSLLISSLLSNSESWYNLKNEEIVILEKVDEMLLRKVLECPAKTPKEMLYLELNCLPIRYIITSRRINFLSYILREDKTSLIYQFLQVQLRKPSKNDWGQTVIKDLEELKIDTPISEIENTPKRTFKRIIREKVQAEALKYLNNEKSKHSKVASLTHSELKMQEYLCPNNLLSVDEAKFLFLLRCRMLDVKCNYRGSHTDTLCPVCEMAEDTQQHVLDCPGLDEGNEMVNKLLRYDDLFCEELETNAIILRVMKTRFKKRCSMKN